MTNNVDLLSPFPKELVKKAPAGKFGDYVPHAHYVERLRDSGVKYSWSCKPVYGRVDGIKRIVGAKGTITIDGMGSFDGFGDVDTFKLNNDKFNDGSNLKDAESDAFKRACMRFGLGVELWTGSKQSEEDARAVTEDKVEVTKVDMRKKENKPTKDDIAKMEAIMDSIVGTDG
jgi:predicted dehydrogenase